jgi:hypothetical protein
MRAARQGSHQLSREVMRTAAIVPLIAALGKGPLAPHDQSFFHYFYIGGHRIAKGGIAVHHVIVEVGGRPGGTLWVPVISTEPTLVRAIVSTVREVEARGHRVIGVNPDQHDLLEAADLVLRLRMLAEQLSEEELVLLLDLLPV